MDVKTDPYIYVDQPVMSGRDAMNVRFIASQDTLFQMYRIEHSTFRLAVECLPHSFL